MEVGQLGIFAKIQAREDGSLPQDGGSTSSKKQLDSGCILYAEPAASADGEDAGMTTRFLAKHLEQWSFPVNCPGNNNTAGTGLV